MQRLDLGERDRRRDYVNLKAALGHPCRSHGLDAEVNCDHTESRFTVWRHDVGVFGTHLVSEMSAHHRGLSLDAFQQRRCAGFHAGDAHPHRASLSDVAGEGARINLAHADDALRAQLELEVSAGPPARGDPSRVAYHVTSDPNPAGFAVLVVPTGIADVRRRRYHHLAVVAGISQGLLITGHAGCEDCLTKGFTDSAKGPSVEGATVL